MSPSRTAIVFGATGLIGGILTRQLLEHPAWNQIVVFTRRTTGIQHPKLKEFIDPMTDLNSLAGNLQGDDLFICLGTTIRKAGSKQVFEATDLQLPSGIAKLAVSNQVTGCSVVSSLGADAGSSNFYLSVKGKMEDSLRQAGFQRLYIFRPSMLLGPRSESRPMETAGKLLMKGLAFLFIGPLKKYRAIEAADVAKAMVSISASRPPSVTLESDAIRDAAKKSLR